MTAYERARVAWPDLHYTVFPCGAMIDPDEPTGYLAKYDWAHRKLKTHTQKRCPKCKLWHVWRPKR